jgi:DNA excision repair protein ERCC-2
VKQELAIAVRELTRYVLRSGDLSSEFFGSGRPVEAIRAHQMIQRSRPDQYLAEVPITRCITTDQLILNVGGRIDGVYPANDPPMVEEIKTTTRDLEYFAENPNPVHWGQLKCYAWLYAAENQCETIDTQLTYYNLDNRETRDFRHRYQTSELEGFFNELVERYIAWAAIISHWVEVRNHTIRSLEFPFPSYRAGQRELAVEVYRTLKNNTQLLVQAATGIGKTMAVLFSAIKALPDGDFSKIFYLTARTTGRNVAENTLAEMRSSGLRLKSITLTAKEKICFNPEQTCGPDECEYARGHYDRIGAALSDIFQSDALTRDAIEETARRHLVCPFEFSLDLSYWADCIICDYNYVFDPRVRLRRFFQESSDDYVFLVDEAHNLVDRSREMFSAELTKQPFLDVRRALKKDLATIYRHLTRINSWLVTARRKCSPAQPAVAEKRSPEKLYPRLRKFLSSSEQWLARNIKASYRDDLMALFFSVSNFLRVAEQYDPCYATCYEQVGPDFRVKLFCMDPSTRLKEVLKRSRATVFFSATMTPMDYFVRVFGCNAEARRLHLPSPFPPENFALLVCDQVSTLYRNREETKSEVSQAIRAVVEQKTGNYLFFFPSYEYMQMVHNDYQVDASNHETIIVQRPGMTELERDRFLDRFMRNQSHTLVAFAVMGGIFGEAIDLVGDRLFGAVVVGVGLPGLCLERELLREYFAENGFDFAYMYPGLNRVLQAAGRVIRSENDRGVVLLIDRRYGTYRYRSLLPSHWRPVTVRSHQRLASVLQHFWSNEAVGKTTAKRK